MENTELWQVCLPKPVRGFLGLIGYYPRFITDYGFISRPLTKMLKKDAFKWAEEVEKSVHQLKETMRKAPVLALRDFTLQFVAECDASGTGTGAALMQNKRPIVNIYTSLKGKDLALSTYEKELMTLALAVQQWRRYLVGRHFIVNTDQRSPKYLGNKRFLGSPTKTAP